MQRLTRARTVLALALVGALALAGCGGGGDNGAEQDLRDQLAMLQTDLDAANAAKMTAEAAQAAAAEAQADAEAAQATAETDRDAANTAKGAAEQAATNAMAAQAAAEGAQTDAEAAQATAEAAQIAAQTAQATAETDRDAAKAAQMAADAAQATAEAAQVAAVAAQATAETERDAAMAAEMAAMEAQAAAEAAQMTAEQAAATAMAAQAAAEAARDADAETLATATAERDAAKDAEAAAMVAQATAEAAQMVAETAQAEAEAAEMAADEAAAAAKMAADEKVAMAEAAAAAAAQAQMDAETARDEAMKAQETAQMERDAANTAKMEADDKAMKAEEAQATAEGERDDYKMMAEEAAKAKKTAEDAAEVARQAQMDAEAERDKYKGMLTDLEDEVDTGDTMDANAAAKELLAVLANNNVGGEGNVNTSGLSAEIDPDAEDAQQQQTNRNDVGNLMVEVSSDGMLMVKVDGNKDYSMSDMTPDMIESWRGAMLTRDNADGTMDTVVVYTDIGNDGTATLFDRYESTRPSSTMPRTWAVGTEDTATMKYIQWLLVRRPDVKTEVGGTPTTPTLTFMGTVHGIPGTFSCAAGLDTCEAPGRFADDKVVLAGDDVAAGAWTFIPDADASTYTDDPTYLTFGWWFDKDAGGNPEDFRAFSTASAGLGRRTETSTAGGNLRGSATYKGAAAGKYATASTIAATYEGGHFTAMATITADFDADSTAAGIDRSGIALSGMIDNFMTGDTPRSDWSVKLMADADGNAANGMQPVDDLGTGLGDDADTANVVEVPLTTEWSTGAAAKGTGTWSVMFHGGDNDPTAEALIDVAGNTALPMAAVGTFNAMIGEAARLQGAFGANKMAE